MGTKNKSTHKYTVTFEVGATRYKAIVQASMFTEALLKAFNVHKVANMYVKSCKIIKES